MGGEGSPLFVSVTEKAHGSWIFLFLVSQSLQVMGVSVTLQDHFCETIFLQSRRVNHS